MVDLDLIAAKLAELADRVARVRKHRPASAEVLAADRDALDLVSFNLMLAVQSCLDVASHLIADEGWPPARDLAGSFRRLHEHGLLDAETAAALGRAASLRNVVAHVYANADPDLVFTAASSGLEDLERFARQVAAWAEAKAKPQH
jgi:uncharacterized protein YutE (UPF0331/DUF86 family)